MSLNSQTNASMEPFFLKSRSSQTRRLRMASAARNCSGCGASRIKRAVGSWAGFTLLAIFGAFLDVGVRVGVPAMPLAFMLLFATNFFSAITPQGSSANLLFASSGYLSQRDLYRLGALTTAFNLGVYVVIGIPWLVLLSR